MTDPARNPDDYRLLEVSVTRTRQIAVPKTMSADQAVRVVTRKLLDDVAHFVLEAADVDVREVPMRPFDDDMDISQVDEQ